MTTTARSGRTAARPRAPRVAGPALAWPLAICATWAIARLLGADRIPVLAGPLVPVLAFTPYAAPVPVALAGGALALRRWTMLAVAAAVTAAFAVAVLPRAFGESQPPAGGPPLRLLTANLRLGQADPRTLTGLVRRTHADVLSVQEFTPRADTALQHAGLGGLLPYHVTAPRSGATGSGLFARYPLRALPMFHVADAGLEMPHARLRIPGGGDVEVMAVHLARPMSPYGVGQWNRGFVLVPHGRSRGATRILAGDFNATLDHAPLRALLSHGYRDAAATTGSGLAPTFWKPPLPPITLDHVLADRRCAVRQVTVYDLPGSDHRAVFATLRLP